VGEGSESLYIMKRIAMYVDAQRILSENVGAVFLFYQKQASFLKP